MDKYLIYNKAHDQYECSESCSGYVENKIISSGYTRMVCVDQCQSKYFTTVKIGSADIRRCINEEECEFYAMESDGMHKCAESCEAMKE